ncbi:MAG: hypothetical protein ACSLFP_13445 [Acidimicrobiales bacterium]
MALLVGVAGTAGCSDSDDAAISSTTTTAPPGATEAPRTTVLTVPEGPRPGAGSTFCTSMLRVGQLNPGPDAAPDDVLALTEELLDLLGEAQANTPEGSPPAIDVLLDDFRAVATSLFDAGGDVDAAYAALETSNPEAFARFSTEGARDEAYAFLTVHCGTTPP